MSEQVELPAHTASPHRICFHNPVQFGDLFFSSPFVRHICESNPDRTFYYFLHRGEYVFSGSPISNLKNILSPEDGEEAYYHIANNTYPKFKETLCEFNFKNEKYIILNTWCLPLGCSGDLIFQELLEGFMQILETINDKYQETYNISLIEHDKIMPIVKVPDNIYRENGFYKWITTWRAENGYSNPERNDIPMDYSHISRLSAKLTNEPIQKLVFIFNFVLKSTNTEYNMNETIVSLSVLYPHYTIIVPNHCDLFDSHTNIICCDKMFGYTEKDSSFKNVFMLDKIANSCDLLISQVCGASWIWFNQNAIQYIENKIPIYITHHSPNECNPFSKKMNLWFELYYREIYRNSKEPKLCDPCKLVSYICINDLSTIFTE